MLGHINEQGGNPQASIIGDGKTSWGLVAEFKAGRLATCFRSIIVKITAKGKKFTTEVKEVMRCRS